ncbi:Retrovirus-related Pol polyprotein from transposon RE1 [Vitis vinifera]|uniref:Retrovirus-related Pol polyprotein from transposon RE1 n=1 Tax=Vitis vinifera TaxID=29760 RepID=A0A438CR41_VITVI|nr:Retrovirus-related Pol polyprotein from transposon RE1 [Vitis vinifera]
MVRGLPHLLPTTLECTDCLNGKQHRDPIPRRVHGGQPKAVAYTCRYLWSRDSHIKWQKERLVEKETRMYIKCLRTDRGGEFNSEEFNEFCRQCGIKRQLTIAYTPQQNGVDERKNRTVMNMVRSMLSEKKIQKPFGLRHVKKVVTSRDIVFEEDRQWEWDTSYEEQVLVDLESSDDDKNNTEDNEGDENLEAASEGNEEAEGNENQAAANDAGDAAVTDASDAPAEGSYARKEGSDVLLFGWKITSVAVMSSKWRLAMDSEINSIEKNQTWKLTDLPAGAKTIGVKWIYKTKLNKLGEVDKYKAWLVAKGYSQQQGVDFTEIYAPVARMDIVRMIVALAAQRGWTIYQLDVKSAFLHGELSEDVRIEAYFISEGFKSAQMSRLYSPRGVVQNSMMKVFDMTDLGRMRFFLALSEYDEFQTNGGKFDVLTATRPDIMFSVSLISRYMAKPTELHLQVTKGFEILKGHCKLWILYKKGGEEELLAFMDSDYAGDIDDRKSTSGYVFFKLRCHFMVIQKQPIVTLSTTEVEFVVAAACACQAIWMRRVLKKLSHEQKGCTTIMCDNSSTIKLS